MRAFDFYLIESRTMSDFLFTSESVSEGHPDKVADQISDAILDAILAQDPYARVAAETLTNTGLVVLAGEITTTANVDYIQVARNTIKRIGYDNTDYGIDYKGCAVLVAYDKQSPDIAQGVDRASDDYLNQGAGDQGLMFGYACDETPTLMPLPIYLAHRLVERQAELRHDGRLPWLRPDAKSQVTIRYVDGKPHSIDTVVLSTQHAPEMTLATDPRSRDRGDHQAGAAEGTDQGQHQLSGQPDRAFRHRRTAGRLRPDRTQDHRRYLRRRGPARRRRVLRQGSVQGGSLRSVCRPLCREEHRRCRFGDQVPGADILCDRRGQADQRDGGHLWNRQDFQREDDRTGAASISTCVPRASCRCSTCCARSTRTPPLTATSAAKSRSSPGKPRIARSHCARMPVTKLTVGWATPTMSGAARYLAVPTWKFVVRMKRKEPRSERRDNTPHSGLLQRKLTFRLC